MIITEALCTKEKINNKEDTYHLYRININKISQILWVKILIPVYQTEVKEEKIKVNQIFIDQQDYKIHHKQFSLQILLYSYKCRVKVRHLCKEE